MQELGLHDLWFQQDSAIYHTVYAIDLLKDEFDEHFILRSVPVNWQPKSCDLTPLDYFLWGYVKAYIYKGKPVSINAL